MGLNQLASGWMLLCLTQPHEGPYNRVVWVKCLLLSLEMCVQRVLMGDVSASWVLLCRLSLPALG